MHDDLDGDGRMTAPPPPGPSASLILLRDGAGGLELLMIERHAGLSFAPGAMVFPGGGLEEQDRSPDWRGHCRSAGEDGPRRIAAIRESFEECGLLLARPRGSEGLLGEAPEAEGSFLDQARSAGLELATDRLVPFAHWITPETVRRRFDTLFYLAPAPPGQVVRIDGAGGTAGEAVAALWGTPRAILARAEAGELRLVFATGMILRRLAGCATVAEAEQLARRAPIPPILPVLAETPAGPVYRIPEGAGYSPTEVPAGQVRLG